MAFSETSALSKSKCIRCGRPTKGRSKFGLCYSCAAKAMWRRPRHRSIVSAAVRAAWQIPENKEKLKKPKSEATRIKMRKAQQRPELRALHSAFSRGKKNYFFCKPGANRGKFGDEHPMFGYRHSPETLQKYSETRRGEKNPFWRGGTRLDPHGREFDYSLKKRILDRDEHRCRVCGKLEGSNRLQVHHVNYIKTDNRPKNLITLCVPCHAKTTVQSRKKWPRILAAILAKT